MEAVLIHPEVCRESVVLVRTGRSAFASECMMVMVLCWCCEQSGRCVDRSLGMGVEEIVEWVCAVIFHLVVCKMVSGMGSKEIC